MATEPIRIYCGADRSQRLAFRVLEHSIRRHCARPLEIHAIDNGDAPAVSDPLVGIIAPCDLDIGLRHVELCSR